MIDNKKVIAVIAEFNPFHLGHKKLFDEIKKVFKDCYIIVLMSSNFTQKAIPAIVNKYNRCEIALKNGASIIIELPISATLSSAKYFAKVSINILNKLNFVDYIAFGSNINDIFLLNKISNKVLEITSNTNINNPLKNNLKNGMNYAKALGISLNQTLSPNDILAIEYLNNLKYFNSKIKPICFKRDTNLLSATDIRNIIFSNISNLNKELFNNENTKNFNYIKSQLKNQNSIHLNNFSDYLNYILFYTYENDFSFDTFYTIDTPLSNQIIKTSNINISFENRVNILHTKNKTASSIRRSLLNILLNIKTNNVTFLKNDTISYIRIIGIKKECTNILNYIKIPYFTSYSKSSLKNFINKYKTQKLIDKTSLQIKNKMLFNDIYASNIYSNVANINNESSSKFILV